MLRYMARSSSGSGRRPLKAEITGSNPVRATIDCLRLLREPFSCRGFFDAGHIDRILSRRKKFKLGLAHR